MDWEEWWGMKISHTPQSTKIDHAWTPLWQVWIQKWKQPLKHSYTDPGLCLWNTCESVNMFSTADFVCVRRYLSVNKIYSFIKLVQ